MVGFILITLAFILFLVLFCLLLYAGLRKDTLNYDMDYLWETYPAEVRAKIRKTFD